jgi:glycosyltransferase involved in cell wall biosynthesis
MRILMISALEVWALRGQGGAPSLFKTLEGLGRRGHQVDFVSSKIGANHHHGAPKQVPPPIEGVTFHLFDLPSLGQLPAPLPGIVAKADQKVRFAALFPYLAARESRRLLASKRYDLLYGYEVHGLLAQRLVRRGHDLPLVARFQGTVMHPYLGRPLSLARRLEEVAALKTPADLYVMTNDGTQGDEVLARLNTASAGKVRFWRNGLDFAQVRAPSEAEALESRRALGLADDDFVLVTSARLARWKRIDRAIDAVALLRDRHGTVARLIVVGDGEERANLEAQVDELGLRDRVRFTGAVPQSEVTRYLWAADIFLSLNELSNVGNPLLEAMRTGCCIVTLDEGDTRDLVQNDATGLLLPAAGAPSTIASAIAQLAADSERRDRLGAGALAFATENFWSWQERIDAEVDALAAIAGKRPVPIDAAV